MRNIDIGIKNLNQNQILQLCQFIEETLQVDIRISDIESEQVPTVLITETLVKMGMYPNTEGYQYTKIAVQICIINEGMITHMVKQIYPQIASLFYTTPSKVEHAMREAIQNSLKYGDIKMKEAILGEICLARQARLTNSEFVARVADYITMNMVNNSHISTVNSNTKRVI